MQRLREIWRTDRGRLAHYLVVVALGTFLVVEYTTASDPVGNPLEPRGWLVALAVLAAAALLFTRDFPFVAPLVAAGSVVGSLAVSTDPLELQNLNSPFLVVILFTPWCLGFYNPVRRAIAGLVSIEGLGVLANIQFGETASDYIWLSAFITVSWIVGFVLNRRAELAQELRERAIRLEQEQREAAERAVAEERQRIARELHDVIAHSVSVMTVQAGAVRRLLLAEQVKEREALETVEATGREALTEMRRLVGLLREQGAMPEFAPQPGLERLDALLEGVRAAGLPVELDVAGTPRELPAGVDLAAYRVVQEALTNALKYAGPAHAWVSVSWGEDDLELEVANDGSSDGNGPGGGHGLAGMQERVALYGGEITSGPRTGGGYVVRARLPFAEVAT